MSVFSTKVLIGDTIFTFRTGDGTAIGCSSEPGEDLPLCRAKGVPSFLSHFKTLSVGPIPGIELATSRSAVKRSTYRANPVAVTRTFRGISDKELNVCENLRENDTKTYYARYNSVHWDFSRPLFGGTSLYQFTSWLCNLAYLLPRTPSTESVSRAGLQYWPAESQRTHNQVCVSYVSIVFLVSILFSLFVSNLFTFTDAFTLPYPKTSLRLNDNHVFVATVLVYHATVFLCRHAMLLPQASRDHKKRLRWRVPAYRHLEQAEYRLVFYLFSSRKQKREENLL